MRRRAHDGIGLRPDRRLGPDRSKAEQFWRRLREVQAEHAPVRRIFVT